MFKPREVNLNTQRLKQKDSTVEIAARYTYVRDCCQTTVRHQLTCYIINLLLRRQYSRLTFINFSLICFKVDTIFILMISLQIDLFFLVKKKKKMS